MKRGSGRGHGGVADQRELSASLEASADRKLRKKLRRITADRKSVV